MSWSIKKRYLTVILLAPVAMIVVGATLTAQSYPADVSIGHWMPHMFSWSAGGAALGLSIFLRLKQLGETLMHILQILPTIILLGAYVWVAKSTEPSLVLPTIFVALWYLLIIGTMIVVPYEPENS